MFLGGRNRDGDFPRLDLAGRGEDPVTAFGWRLSRAKVGASPHKIAHLEELKGWLFCGEKHRPKAQRRVAVGSGT